MAQGYMEFLNKTIIFIVLTVIFLNPNLYSNHQTISVYLDCKSYCDVNYIKTELGFVNFAREISDADVYIMVDYLQTAAKGYEYHITFNGQKGFTSKDNELRFIIPPNATQALLREKLANYLKIGLIDYLKATEIIDRIKISFEDEKAKPVKTTTDVWKNWIFSVSFGAYLNSDSNYQFTNLNSHITANNTTSEREISLLYLNFIHRRKIKLSSGYYTTETKSDNLSFKYTFKIYEHWGAGFFNSMRRSTYNNYDFSLNNCGAVEYSFFPYQEALKRKVKLSYHLCQLYNDYHEETIYYKTKESLLKHGLSLTLDFKRKWGDFYTSLECYNYFQYPSKALFTFNTSLSFKLGSGFSLSLGYEYSYDNSNINISRTGLTDEEVLLRTKELKNNYSSSTSFNLTYRFGSLYNNSVNTVFK